MFSSGSYWSAQCEIFKCINQIFFKVLDAGHPRSVEDEDLSKDVKNVETNQPANSGDKDVMQVDQLSMGNNDGMIKVMPFLKLDKIIYFTNNILD